MKKITLISLGQTGAGPVYSLEMAKALEQSGKCKLQVIVSESVTNIDVWKEAFEGSDIQFCVVRAYNHTNLSVFIHFFNYSRKWRILKLIKAFEPDILYVPFGLMWSRFIYAFLPKHTKIIRTIHDVKAHDRFSFGEVMSDLLTAGSNHYVDGYVILNAKDKAIVENRFKKPVAVIPHASFSYYFKESASSGTEEIKHRIGFFGRIEPYKGLDLLVDAYEQSKTPNLKLLIAGSGAIETSLLERIKSNNNIELINRYIDDDEFQPLLDSVDFVVLPYKRASQSGVIPMCFAYGKTVIATNVGALEEQIPGGTGIITSPEVESIRYQIDNLYANTALIGQYGQKAKQYAEEELSWDKSAALLLSFVEKLKYESK